jgi:Planctomycete cytochrome C
LRASSLICVVVTSGLVGCLDPFAPEVGPPQRPVCTNEDSNPDHDVVFATDVLENVLKKDCGFCHNPDGATPIGIMIGGLDMSSFAALRRGGANSQRAIIVPGKPCDSILIKKVLEGPPFGARMPLNGPPYLSVPDIDILRDWIAEGAHE